MPYNDFKSTFLKGLPAVDFAEAKTLLFKITQIKHNLIQQLAIDYIKKLSSYDADEIIEINTYVNHVANDYGIPLEDLFLDWPMEHAKLEKFADYLNHELTPKQVLSLLISEVSNEFLQIQKTLQTYFKDHKQKASSCDLMKLAEQLIDEFNKQHTPLIELDVSSLVQISDDHKLRFFPYNEIALKVQVVKGFRRLFLLQQVPQVIYKVGEEEWHLFSDNGVMWIEKEAVVYAYTPEIFLQLIQKLPSSRSLNDENICCLSLNYFINDVLLLDKKTIKTCISSSLSQTGENLLYLLTYHNQFPLIEQLIEHGFITQSLLQASPRSGKHMGKNILFFLIYAKQFPLIERLLERGLITQSLLQASLQSGEHTGKNMLWILAVFQQYPLIERLLEKYLITQEQLEASPQSEEQAGINTLWVLFFAKQFPLIERLLDQGLITQKQLQASPLSGEQAGINALWLLADSKEFPLMERLLKKHLITPEQLEVSPQSGEHVGKNTFYFLICARQFPLIERLLDQGLITQEQLQASPQSGEQAGINALWVLFFAKQFPLIKRLLNEHLITLKQLESLPHSETHTGISALWFLTDAKEFPLIECLLDQGLITQGQLQASPQSGKLAGINALWLLVQAEQYSLIERLLDEGLITQEQLQTSPQSGEQASINALWVLFFAKQFPLIKRLLNEHLITLKQLESSPQSETHTGMSALWFLTDAKEFPLIECLLDEGLITQEQLQASPQSGEQININALWILVQAEQYSLIERLLEKRLITAEQLEASPQSGEHTGINALWLLVQAKQYSLIERLLEKRLITAEQLEASPQSGEHTGINALWLLVQAEQYSLIERLLEKRLITAEQLEASPQSGEHTGINALWLLVQAKQYSLIERLLEKHLITAAQLEASPQSGEHTGKNALCFLVQAKQYPLIKRLIEFGSLAGTTQASQSFIFTHLRIQDTNLMEEDSNLPSLNQNSSSLYNYQPNQVSMTDIEQDSSNENTDFSIPASRQIPQSKKAGDKRAYFSKKYYPIENALQEIHYLNEDNVAPEEFTYRHQMITLATALNIGTMSNLHFEEIMSENFLILTSLHYYSGEKKDLSKQEVTFVFAGRANNAHLPNLNHMGENQQCIAVLTSAEYLQLSIKSYPKSLGFLVINTLDSESHGDYTNTGCIQARRLAAFYASHHWQLNNCIYLDDNIDWVGLNLEHSSNDLSWSDITNYLREKRESSHSLIAGLRTISNKVSSHQTTPDYCYKIYSMNFQFIRELLELKNKEDIYILGYPAVYANICAEDFFFQMMIDFANNTKNNSEHFLHISDKEHAGIKRSLKKQSLAKKSLQSYLDLLNMSLEQFTSNVFNQQHKEWITASLIHLKRQTEINKKEFEARQEFERKRSDLPQVIWSNMEKQTNKKRSQTSIDYIALSGLMVSESDTQAAPPKKKKITKKTKKTMEWTPCFSGVILNELMNGGELEIETYLSNIDSFCYPYQQEVLKVIAQTDSYNGVLKIATGAGKTRVQIILTDYLVAQKIAGPIHIVTATQQLVDQFYLSFQEVINLLAEKAHFNMDHVIKIKSGSGNVPWKNYYTNDTLKQQAKVVIFCQESYDKFQCELNKKSDSDYLPPAIILLDEFHLYLTMAKKLLNSKATVLAFSATPPKDVNPIYSFSRLDSLHCNITAPMIIDRLPYQLSNTNENRAEKIGSLIQEHCHPSSGRPLKESKGVIFVSSIDEANQLANSLNQRLKKRLVRAIHSNVSNYNQLITQFQNQELDKPGILIVVGLLQTGYDDKNLSWCIIARNNNENSTTVYQIIGRVLRKNPTHPEKIAYVIADTHLNISEFGPLRDCEAIKLANEKYFKANYQIIYLDILRAIKAQESFESYKSLFELNRLHYNSFKKHLELLLHANNEDWLTNLCIWNQQLTNEATHKQDPLSCFAKEACSFFDDQHRTENKELYSVNKFNALLGTLNHFMPNKLKSWLLKTEEQSGFYFAQRMKTKHNCDNYLIVFNKYKRMIITSMHQDNFLSLSQNGSVDSLKDKEKREFKTASSSHSLFAQNTKCNQQVINTSYEYEGEDVQLILRLRLKDCHVSGLNLLAAANMTADFIGNRVEDVFSLYLASNEMQMEDNTVEQNIIIPIAFNHHWIGIRIQLKQGHTTQVTYYNSIKGYEPDRELMLNILTEVNQALSDNTIWSTANIHPYAQCLEQNDGTSCGPFLIENIYSDLTQISWAINNPDLLSKTLRECHLKLLSKEAPDFYRSFYNRQATNQSTIFSSMDTSFAGHI